MNSMIYLVGFMGCGKTTIGELLARKTGYKSIDLDHYIVETTHKSIPELFETYGEDYFRKIEHECLKVLSQMGHGIICTGGGVVKEAVNRAFLSQECCIYLDVAFDTLYERIAQDANRPLAKDKTSLYDLYRGRQAWYEEVATYTIEGNGKTPLQVVDEIIQVIK
ncbi:MAG: shikimate kinase [Cellulosilyticaceae bacterium]